MDAYHRPQVQTLVERLREEPRHIIAVFGPRQTGKTTLVRQALATLTDRPKHFHNLDVVDAEGNALDGDATTVRLPRAPDAEWLVRAWRAAGAEADLHPRGLVLVLDEIQVIPQWSSVVKGLWDADRAANRQMHVVILGSAPLRVQSGLTESLAGRFEPLRVAHWSFEEMADAFGFDLPQYIYFGGYPGGAQFVREEERWREYVLGALVGPSIEKDIVAMTRVDKPALLRQLFELGTEYSGQILAYNKMLGQLQDAGNATTLVRYLDLLTTAGLLAGLSKRSRSPRRVRASTPKLNVLNTALMTAGSGYTFAEAQSDRTFWGRVVESAIGAHILNAVGSDVRVHYWREGPHEVDFVLARGPKTIAIEVKGGASSRRPAGLDAFTRRFRPQRAMLVGQGGTPLDEFLTTPISHWFDTT